VNKYGFIFLIFVLLYCLFIISEKNPYNGESFSGKGEWASLQAMYSGQGNKKSIGKHLSIIKYENKHALLINENLAKEAHNINRECLVLLDCEYPPYYKSFGQCKNITISLDELRTIEKYVKLPVTVRHILLKK